MTCYIVLHPKRFEEDPNLLKFIQATPGMGVSLKIFDDLSKCDTNFGVMYIDLKLDHEKLETYMHKLETHAINTRAEGITPTHIVNLITDIEDYEKIVQEDKDHKVEGYYVQFRALDFYKLYKPKDVHINFQKDVYRLGDILSGYGWVKWFRYNHGQR